MGKDIIVIEDDEELGLILCTLLKLKGHNSIYITGIEELKKFLKINEKKVTIIADVIIRGRSIIDELLKLKKEFPDINIVFTTAHSKYASQLKTIGINCILKPYNAEEIISYIK